MEATKILTAEQIRQLKQAIADAEKQTSGEVRVFIEDHSEDGPLDRAAFLFGQLGMDKTALRNGVLIYVSFRDRKFCIIGDEGIHQIVGYDFWGSVKNKMQTRFREGLFFEGIMDAIAETGLVLSQHFPVSPTDSNELPNEILFGGKKE